MLCEFPNQRILFTKARSVNGILQSDYRCNYDKIPTCSRSEAEQKENPTTYMSV